MKVLCSRWMVRVVAVAGLFVSMMMFFADGGINFVGLGICLVVVLGGLLWASCDVVVITSRKIFRGFKSLELEKIQDLVLLPGERFIAPNIKSCKGYEIVALTAKGSGGSDCSVRTSAGGVGSIPEFVPAWPPSARRSSGDDASAALKG